MKRILAITGLATALLLTPTRKADAGVDFSIGIGVPVYPAYTYAEPYYSPTVVYRTERYAPPATYDTPPVYYGYERGYEHRSYDDDWGRREGRRHGWRDAGWNRHGRHCDR